jgi:hypothetical protein
MMEQVCGEGSRSELGSDCSTMHAKAMITMVSWPLAPSSVFLGDDQIHLWCAILSDFASEQTRLEAIQC